MTTLALLLANADHPATAYLNLFVFGCACALLAAYLCRMDKLNWRRHRTSGVLLYAANASATVMVAAHAWQGALGQLDAAALLCAACLLRVSWPRWVGGQPPADLVREVQRLESDWRSMQAAPAPQRAGPAPCPAFKNSDNGGAAT